MIDIVKQKQVYFLFSKMENTEQYDKTVYGLVIDFFIDTSNSYGTLKEISSHINSKGIYIEPEVIWSSLNALNTKKVFKNFPDDENEQPFKLKAEVYEDFRITTDYISQLHDYVQNFLDSHNFPRAVKNEMIDILLETIFNLNIKYLKQILTVKDEKKTLLNFRFESTRFNAEVHEYYNTMIQSSNGKFDEILQALILRMFDFLSLNYNPKHHDVLKKRFDSSTYYLDSSFIIRLLGFDNELRKNRSLELIRIINSLDKVKFCVHAKTIDETQRKVLELISKYEDILNKPVNVIRKLTVHVSKQSNLIDLYLHMYDNRVINGVKDFRLYFRDIRKLLTEKIKGLCVDNNSLYTASTKRQELFNALQHTNKTRGRINHIVKLLDYIDKLRGANNFNPFDIKFWLITTDKTTLRLDAAYIEEANSKSVCIMPSELIRLIDNVGDIKGEHLSVFKKYMLHSHVFPDDYNDKDIETVSKIATIVENTDLEKYDVDTMINNLFIDQSYDDIQSRLKKIEDQEERDKELVKMFVSANSEYMDSNYNRIYSILRKRFVKQATAIWTLLTMSLPVGLILYILLVTFNWRGIVWNNLTTYIERASWSSFLPVFTIVTGLILTVMIYVKKKYANHFIKWYAGFKMNKYEEKNLENVK